VEREVYQGVLFENISAQLKKKSRNKTKNNHKNKERISGNKQNNKIS
jgi:hypothetical protein